MDHLYHEHYMLNERIRIHDKKKTVYVKYEIIHINI